MNLLDNIVKEMIEQHKGGEKFFDHLDKEIQKEPVINELINLIDNENIIVSGKFGVFFSNYIKTINKNLNIILVNGGLRTGSKINSLDYLSDRIHNKKFLFVDDSFYSGKTRNIINEEFKIHNGEIIKTLVVYDGSKEKDYSVKSLYRYYDNYKGEVA